MRRLIATLILLLGMTSAVDAAAQDKLLDLRQPSVVADALRQAGYKAEMKTNSKGEPYIDSSANGSSERPQPGVPRWPRSSERRSI